MRYREGRESKDAWSCGFNLPKHHNTTLKTSEDRIWRPMGRYMKQHDKEYLKMAILKQETAFRQQVASCAFNSDKSWGNCCWLHSIGCLIQVHELHRLYQVQHLLMREMKNTNKKIQLDEHCRALDLELPAEQFSGKQHRNVVLETYQESDLQLTLATGSSTRRKETSTASDCGSSFSSSSTQSGTTKQNGNRSGLFQVPEIDMRFNHDRHSGFKIEEQMRQDGVKQRTWFSQCLGMNMTWLLYAKQWDIICGCQRQPI